MKGTFELLKHSETKIIHRYVFSTIDVRVFDCCEIWDSVSTTNRDNLKSNRTFIFTTGGRG